MSKAVSNLSLSFSLPCGRRASNSSKPQCLMTLPHCFKPIGKGLSQNSIRAMAGETKDNLDHLHRVNKPQQPHPKKRVAPVAPLGIYINPNPISVLVLSLTNSTTYF